MFRNLKADEQKSGSGRDAQSKLLVGKKDGKKKQSQVSDIGVIDSGDGKDGKEGKEQNDSFEKHYNKDLDLDEGKCVRAYVG